ncbi:DNA-binding protein [Paenibacillus sp. RC84]|uniref:DNA-binding protein n=1 Tax=Paenibacillus sp. RC84 TaxID=3156252 RepID=UPI003516A7DD
MIKVEFDLDHLQKMISMAVEQAIQKHEFANTLPPLMTKAQLMDVLEIGGTKATELMNREDFPVTREFGHPRVVTSLFMQWIEAHTEWINENSSPDWLSKRKGA